MIGNKVLVTYLIETVDSQVLPKHLGWGYRKSKILKKRQPLSPGVARVSYLEGRSQV